MTPEELALTVALTIAGIGATAFFANWALKKGARDVNRRLDSIESLELANARISQDANPEEGKPVKREDGHYSAHFDRKIYENVTISDHVTVIKKPGTEREERI